MIGLGSDKKWEWTPNHEKEKCLTCPFCRNQTLGSQLQEGDCTFDGEGDDAKFVVICIFSTTTVCYYTTTTYSWSVDPPWAARSDQGAAFGWGRPQNSKQRRGTPMSLMGSVTPDIELNSKIAIEKHIKGPVPSLAQKRIKFLGPKNEIKCKWWRTHTHPSELEALPRDVWATDYFDSRLPVEIAPAYP